MCAMIVLLIITALCDSVKKYCIHFEHDHFMHEALKGVKYIISALIELTNR